MRENAMSEPSGPKIRILAIDDAIGLVLANRIC